MLSRLLGRKYYSIDSGLIGGGVGGGQEEGPTVLEFRLIEENLNFNNFVVK